MTNDYIFVTLFLSLLTVLHPHYHHHFCPIIVVTFVYKFHILNVSIIIGWNIFLGERVSVSHIIEGFFIIIHSMFIICPKFIFNIHYLKKNHVFLIL